MTMSLIATISTIGQVYVVKYAVLVSLTYYFIIFTLHDMFSHYC